MTYDDLACIDIETKDPELKGPRDRRGFITGIALSHAGYKGYLNLRHEGGPDDEKEALQRIDQIHRYRTPIVGTNLKYDVEWLRHWTGNHQLFHHNQWIDVQINEPLIDENQRRYNLDAIAARYGLAGKDTQNLHHFIEVSGWKGKPQSHYWRVPYFMIQDYAVRDIDLPLEILRLQEKEIESQGLQDIVALEQGLQPMLMDMRILGVRIDEDGLAQLLEEFNGERATLLDQLGISPWSAKEIGALCDIQGIEYPRTPTGLPSFTKEWLASHPHPLMRNVLKARQLDKLVGTFLEGHLLGHLVNGRVHCQFNQLRSDNYGTVTGRFSSSQANLQQIPSRTEMGRRIRRLFIPEEGCQWTKLDYSQIEPRLLLTYAPSHIDESRAMVEAYRKDPALDCYNQMMVTMPTWLSRPDVKAIFLGASYSMGIPTMAQHMGVSLEEAEKSFHAFHAGAPYIKALEKRCSTRASNKGFIRTIGGRRRRFNEWVARQEEGDDLVFSSREAAVDAGYPWAKRGYTYRALNALIQGGAADIMKRAMLDGYREGLVLPHLTVHDELDASVNDRKQAQEWADVMESAYAEMLKVRMRVDVEIGPNWGEVK